MNTITLPHSGLVSSRLAYGCWRLAGTSDPTLVTPEKVAHAHESLKAAYEAGYTFFDHADVYCAGMAEGIFGQVLQAVSGMRDRIVIGTKCGVRRPNEPDPGSPYRYDFSAEHIVRSCEESLTRLGVERIDLYLLHRPDYLMDPQEVAAAFSRLKQNGKVREFGVSNFRPSQVAMLQKVCPMRLIVNQVEISLSRLDTFEDGTVDQCQTEGICPMAWSPLGGGRLVSSGPVGMQDPNHARRLKLQDTMDQIAREFETTRMVIALAWLLKHPSGIVPIVGSNNPDRIREAVRATTVTLTREHWYRLMESARGQRLP